MYPRLRVRRGGQLQANAVAGKADRTPGPAERTAGALQQRCPPPRPASAGRYRGIAMEDGAPASVASGSAELTSEQELRDAGKSERKEEKKSKKHKKKHKKKKHTKKKRKQRSRDSSDSSDSGSGSSSSGGGGWGTTRQASLSSSYAPARPNASTWSSAAPGPSAASMLGVSQEELARQALTRKRRFEATTEVVKVARMKLEASQPKQRPRMAHSGGKITHNKDSAIHKFTVRLLREGKELTEEQAAAARAAGVDTDRLKQVFS